MFSDEEVHAAWQTTRDASNDDVRAVMAFTANLLAERGGTEHGAMIISGMRHGKATLIEHFAIQGARNAMLEAELENLRPFEALHADLSAQLREAWTATGVSGTVKGMTTLADVVGVTKADLRDALARAAVLEAEVARLTQHEADLGSRFDALASKHSAAQELISDLEQRLERARKERQELRITLDGRTETIDAVERALNIDGADTDLVDAIEALKAARDSAQREALGWIAMETERRQERDAALQQMDILGRNFEEACQKAEALREQLEAEREANRELVRRAQQAEADADKSEAECAHVEADLKDAKATLEMYRNAWKRELGAFLRWKAHEIDALVVSTKRVVDMARDSETWRTKAADYDTERNEAWAAYRKQDARANEAEDEVDRVSTERDALKAKVAELEERCARLSVVGQALSEHADKTAAGPLTTEEAARNALGHSGATP